MVWKSNLVHDRFRDDYHQNRIMDLRRTCRALQQLNPPQGNLLSGSFQLRGLLLTKYRAQPLDA